MSWKRIIGDKDKRGDTIEAFRTLRGQPIPPTKVVPEEGKKPKNPRKDRRKTKDMLRNFEFDN
jgi:hypothetical protein